MFRSMEGLQMPGFPVESFVEATVGVVRRNRDLGFAPSYDPAWEKDNFLSANSVYLRPFSYTEPGIGLNLSQEPFVVVISTPVGSYFDLDAASKAVTTDKVRATKGGTGWIKCDANYVIPTMEKHAMMKKGYMETVFLDAETKSYVEEGSSSNIFFLLEDGTLVTPTLEDTILPGITRASIIQLAKDRGVTVEERRITIDEAMDSAVEAFVTGTAAGIAYLESLTHNGTEKVFRDRKIGDLSRDLLHELKGIQYGAVEDRHGWMTSI
jgi:branched-chain amino acid aminotransferase